MIYLDKVQTMLTILEASQYKELWEMALRFIETGEIPETNDKALFASWTLMQDMIIQSYNNLQAESIQGTWGAVKKNDPEWKNNKTATLGDWYGLQDDFNPDFIKDKQERLKAIGIHENLLYFRKLKEHSNSDTKEQPKADTEVNPTKPKLTYNNTNINSNINPISNPISNPIPIPITENTAPHTRQKPKSEPRNTQEQVQELNFDDAFWEQSEPEQEKKYDYSDIDWNGLPF